MATARTNPPRSATNAPSLGLESNDAAAGQGHENSELSLHQRLHDRIATADERAKQLGEDYGLDKGQVTTLYRNIAGSMYAAVPIGGMPCNGLSRLRGYGWPHCDWSRRDNARGSKPPPEPREKIQEKILSVPEPPRFSQLGKLCARRLQFVRQHA